MHQSSTRACSVRSRVLCTAGISDLLDTRYIFLSGSHMGQRSTLPPGCWALGCGVILTRWRSFLEGVLLVERGKNISLFPCSVLLSSIFCSSEIATASSSFFPCKYTPWFYPLLLTFHNLILGTCWCVLRSSDPAIISGLASALEPCARHRSQLSGGR